LLPFRISHTYIHTLVCLGTYVATYPFTP